MRSKPSLEDFRSGGAEGAFEKASVASSAVNTAAQAPTTPNANEKQNKTIRIRKTYNERLADEAFARTKSEGKKVNESDIIDEALEAYFAKQDKARK
ncbi:hypothetical protein [Pseudomonas monteilii]|uniref:hypothetical protein n=1 Tax=Pseudomonas monteilii TaxID=76759 RepID=UPI0015FDA054|nr:hypothetical protein [Pseudomonas monteilii]MBA6105296.1 hypothetical protein [Pseudomonas monteilii]